MHEIYRDGCIRGKQIVLYVCSMWEMTSLTGIHKNDYTPRDWLTQSSNYHTVANISCESHDGI